MHIAVSDTLFSQTVIFTLPHYPLDGIWDYKKKKKKKRKHQDMLNMGKGFKVILKFIQLVAPIWQHT